MTQASSRDDVIRQDVADLHKLGYAQELLRSMGCHFAQGHLLGMPLESTRVRGYISGDTPCRTAA